MQRVIKICIKPYTYTILKMMLHVARQRPRNRQLDKGRYYAMTLKQQQRNIVFCVVRAEML
jgi:hypothetical protein